VDQPILQVILVPCDGESSAAATTVRTIIRDREPWFVAADVCAVLGMGNSRMATDRLDDDEKDGVSIADTIGRSQIATAIRRAGAYSTQSAPVVRTIIRDGEPCFFAKDVADVLGNTEHHTGSLQAG